MANSKKITLYLKDCIADNLIKLMKEKPYERITIDEIARAAGVGRSTYFRHFSSKAEILTYKIERFWELKSEELNLQERNKFDINNAKAFFEINYMQKDDLKIIYSAGIQSVLFDAFNKIMISHYDDSTTDKYTGCFYAYGLFGLLDNWIERDFKETPKEMAKLFKNILSE